MLSLPPAQSDSETGPPAAADANGPLEPSVNHQKHQLDLPFPVLRGPPRKDFDERKHLRERKGKDKRSRFARKYARVMSQEVQLILPGLDIPTTRTIVKKDWVVGEGPPRLDDNE